MAAQSWRILAGNCADARGERGPTVVTVTGSRISELAAWTDAVTPEPGDVEARDCLLVPGFIDIHVHGGAGHGVMDCSADGLDIIAAHLLKHGVTGFLPTTITGPWDQQAEAVAIAARAMRSAKNGENGAVVLGCHLEGPYINPKKKGAQPGQFILPPDWKEVESHIGGNYNALRVMTLAPEMEGALPLIRSLSGHKIIPSIGHTDATYEQVSRAIDAGARHVTHCYNAMRGLESREPGVVGAALTRPELSAELIWDNIHVHPASCRALINAKGPEGVILISDGIPGTGMGDGYEFSLGDLPVTVHNGSARLPDGTLAGSLLTLDLAFQNASHFSLPARCAMTSRNAALALGLGHCKGLICPGYDADLTLLNADGTVRDALVRATRGGDILRQISL